MDETQFYVKNKEFLFSIHLGQVPKLSGQNTGNADFCHVQDGGRAQQAVSSG